jgi:hypothetical protein
MDKKNENLPKIGTKHNRKLEHITILTLKVTEGQNYKNTKKYNKLHSKRIFNNRQVYIW